MEPADPGRPGAQLSGEGFFRALLEADRDVTVVLGEGGVIRYATPSAAMLLGPGPAVGARLADLVGDGARAVVDREVRQMLGGAWAAPDPGEGEITWRIDGPGGRRVHVEVRCSDLPAAAAGGIVLTLRDVTSQREREEKLRRMAFHDTLTGLPCLTGFFSPIGPGTRWQLRGGPGQPRPCSSSTWMTSRTSTTPWATPPAMSS